MSSFFYYPLRILVTHPERPVLLNAQLPENLKKITGINATHEVGINLYEDVLTHQKQYESIPSIGWFYLEFNNRNSAYGNLNVGYQLNNLKESPEFEDCSIPLQPNTLITGIYNNEFRPLTASWKNYVVGLYLRCERK